LFEVLFGDPKTAAVAGDEWDRLALDREGWSNKTKSCCGKSLSLLLLLLWAGCAGRLRELEGSHGD
jgi:hypothetical protein